MKILMGVQGTGNGHITRARAMNKAFQKYNLDVDYIFTGREKEKLFDMEEFGDFRCFSGMTFITEAGAVKPVATYRHNKFCQLFSDIKQLDLSPYDLVMTDFEPVSAWAARRQKKPTIAVGHQNAFDYGIPKKGSNPVVQLFMAYFALAQVRLGLHWHHFGQPILPPIADTHAPVGKTIKNKILVYLGFEEPDQVIEWLAPFSDHEFYIYASFPEPIKRGHLHLRPLSREGFQNDLADCNGVISNAGFELASEAIHLGKKLLVKPLKGQMEQLSNALALTKLDLGMEMNTLDSVILRRWLDHFEGKQVVYPDVPDAIVKWVLEQDFAKGTPDIQMLADSLWNQVHSPDIHGFSSQKF